MGITTAVVGAVVSAKGAYDSASAQKSSLGYEAAVARNNAQLAEYQAVNTEAIGAQREQQSRLHTASVMGAQRAGLAASGVELGQGSALDVLATTAHVGEMDAMTIKDNTARTAWARRVQKQDYLNNAAALQSAASAIDPTTAMFASLLGSSGRVNKSWTSKQQSTAGVM
jgi:hypothetical protein